MNLLTAHGPLEKPVSDDLNGNLNTLRLENRVSVCSN